MALSRRSGRRFEANIWPGFVDAMTALLLVLIFIISIFMIVQFMLRETIETQGSELDDLSDSLNTLALQLGLEQQRGSNLEDQVTRLGGLVDESSKEISRQRTLIASLGSKSDSQKAIIANFEQQVLALLADNKDLSSRLTSTKSQLDSKTSALEKEFSEKQLTQLALAKAREEIDEKVEAARLAAAKREAIELLVSEMELDSKKQIKKISELKSLGLLEAAAAEILRMKLKNGNAELTAMSLALEEKRKEAEETLTLLAAAKSLKNDLNTKLLVALSEIREVKSNAALKEASLSRMLKDALAQKILAEKRASDELTKADLQKVLLSNARSQLEKEKTVSLQAKLSIEALNQQLTEVRQQLGFLQGLLNASEEKDIVEKVEVANLTNKLNSALARVASEQRRSSKELKKKNDELNALSLERDSTLKNLKAEQLKLIQLRNKEANTLAALKKKNAQLELFALQRDKALEEEKKDKAEIFKLKQKDRERLEAEAKELKKYQSKFFAEVEKALENQEGIKIKGDRFIFSSEILFEKGKANISTQGIDQIRLVSDIIKTISSKIPPEINWVLRVDGHTDNMPLSGQGIYKDNWELSQARALSVVRYMSDQFNIPPGRLAATGFGEHQPFDLRDTEEARAKNRRIEIKLTER